MKTIKLVFVIVALVIGQQAVFSQGAIIRFAEDLWGNRIPIDSLIRNSTLTIVPFSTSNCGYCLIDGYYTEENYIRANEINGGVAMHMCLFNTQLEIVSFQKHFGWRSKVITWPPAIHQYHEDGFPTLLAFRNGKQVLREFYNYDAFDTLNDLLWTGKTKRIQTGELHMATRLLYENDRMGAVMVVPGDKVITEEMRYEGAKWNAYSVKTVDSLSASDLQKHLFLKGNFTYRELQRFFGHTKQPLKLSNFRWILGEYGFPFDSAGIHACFPNPFNPEKIMVIQIPKGQKTGEPVNWLDYVIYLGNDTIPYTRLCYGHFDKTGHSEWNVSAGRTFSDKSLHNYCIRQCEVPQKKRLPVFRGQDTPVTIKSESSLHGLLYTLGDSAARFPSPAADADSGVWLTWEEEGNILLANINGTNIHTWVAEGTSADAYNPVVAREGVRTWVFWLGNNEVYYRVYGRFLEDNRWSDPILLSGRDACDNITLRCASHGEEVTVAWSEWKANQRYLKMMKIQNGIPGAVMPVSIAPSQYISEYHNAWSPSLCYLQKGEVWGAWNQHYPGNYCVIAGNLKGMPMPVTATAKAMDDWEVGGNPRIFSDGEKNLFTVWESNGWEVYWSNEPQRIRLSVYEPVQGRWRPGIDLPLSGTMQNQSPAGMADEKENLFVVWSGRDTGDDSHWGIWLTIREKGNWSKPVLISPEKVDARHPSVLCSGRDKAIWVSWHAGKGEEMKVQVLRLKRVSG